MNHPAAPAEDLPDTPGTDVATYYHRAGDGLDIVGALQPECRARCARW